MNIQKKYEMEDLYINLYGRDPLYVNEREIKGLNNISYEKYLKESIYSFKQAGSVNLVVIDNDDATEETELKLPVIINDGSKASMGLRDNVADRIGRRINKSAKLLYEKIRKESVEEWKNDINAFYCWFDAELLKSTGTVFIRINLNKPYGPQNCMLTDSIKILTEPLNEKFHTNLDTLYRKMVITHSRKELAPEWGSTHSFIHWIQNHQEQIPERPVLIRINRNKPFGPDNCKFKRVEDVRRNRKNYTDEEQQLIDTVIEIGNSYGTDPVAKYENICNCGDVDSKKWTLKKYLKWVIKQNENNHFAPCLNRLNINKPYSPNNCYFSWRSRGKRTHGMSNTKLYRKYLYFTRYYREHLETKITFEEFMEIALKEKDYQLNSRMKINYQDPITMDSVDFIQDDSDISDINRICDIYRTEIRAGKDGFDGLMKFMEWTIRQGYTSWMDFQKIGKGDYSPETCVWDIFTADAYIRSKGRRITTTFENKVNDS